MNKNQLKLANYMYFEKNDKLRFSKKFFTEAAEIKTKSNRAPSGRTIIIQRLGAIFGGKQPFFQNSYNLKKSEHHLPHSHPNQKKKNQYFPLLMEIHKR
jgi:hypothetical protein